MRQQPEALLAVERRRRVLREAQLEMEQKLSDERRQRRRELELTEISKLNRLEEEELLLRRGMGGGL